jgi:hypothetical protein
VSTLASSLDENLRAGCGPESLYAIRPKYKRDRSPFLPTRMDERSRVAVPNTRHEYERDTNMEVTGLPPVISFDGPAGSRRVDLAAIADPADAAQVAYSTAKKAAASWRTFIDFGETLVVNRNYGLNDFNVQELIAATATEPLEVISDVESDEASAPSAMVTDEAKVSLFTGKPRPACDDSDTSADE